MCSGEKMAYQNRELNLGPKDIPEETPTDEKSAEKKESPKSGDASQED